MLVGFLMLSAWATWPQVGLALLGGSLARRMGRARRDETNSLVRNR